MTDLLRDLSNVVARISDVSYLLERYARDRIRGQEQAFNLSVQIQNLEAALRAVTDKSPIFGLSEWSPTMRDLLSIGPSSSKRTIKRVRYSLDTLAGDVAWTFNQASESK